MFVLFGFGAFGVALFLQITAKKYDYVSAALTVIAWGLAITAFGVGASLGNSFNQVALGLAMVFCVLITAAGEMWGDK